MRAANVPATAPCTANTPEMPIRGDEAIGQQSLLFGAASTSRVRYDNLSRRGGPMSEARRRPWGSLEDEVLATLWAADGPVTAGVGKAEVGGELAYGTVTTILARLAAK